jgi:general secretion pathway protein L
MADGGVEKIPMSVLRIYAALGDATRCEWVLIEPRQSVAGSGLLAELPRGAARVQLVIPAAQVLLTAADLPPGAKRRDAVLLAFAVEAATAAEPDANQVSWLGGNAFAVLDKQGLARWRAALEAVGMRAFELHAETLLLPWSSGEWSLAWNGTEGFVRTGEFEGAATDGGDRAAPPLALRMMLEEGARPQAIAIYANAAELPDLELWEAALGVPLRAAGAWDWRTAPAQPGAGLAQQRSGWRIAPGTLARLRPAAWFAAAALAIHAIALVADWTSLGAEQRRLRAGMEARFRSAFPDAVSVSNPALQMRRQLALARHRAGVPDGGDFAPMIGKAAAALKELPAGGLRGISYEGGRISLELGSVEEKTLRRIAARLGHEGFIVDVATPKLITVRSP